MPHVLNAGEGHLFRKHLLQLAVLVLQNAQPLASDGSMLPYVELYL
jgi:hypothetical protein